MVRPLAVLALAPALAGCMGASPPVVIDLCAAPGATAEDRSTMDGAETWQVVVFILRGEDAAFERSFAADGDASGLLLRVGEAVPPRRDVRLLVRGYEATPDGHSRMVAVASSPPMQLVTGDEVCMCVAPPDRYADTCYERPCVYTDAGGCSFGPASPPE